MTSKSLVWLLLLVIILSFLATYLNNNERFVGDLVNDYDQIDEAYKLKNQSEQNKKIGELEAKIRAMEMRLHSVKETKLVSDFPDRKKVKKHGTIVDNTYLNNQF